MTDTPEEIAALKARLAALEAQAPASPPPIQTVRIAPREGVHPAVKALLWVAVVVVIGVSILAVIGSNSPEANMTASERIEASCKREFPNSEEQSNECRIRLSVKLWGWLSG